MKRITIFLLTISMALMFALTPKAHAYTISNQYLTFYNQTTASLGSADVISTPTTATLVIDGPNANILSDFDTTRLVFSSIITTEELPVIQNTGFGHVYLRFYNNGILVHTDDSYYPMSTSFSYFETNFKSSSYYNNIDWIEIEVTGLSPLHDQEVMRDVMLRAILVSGSNTIINQPIGSTAYQNGWNDAMNSKVTQIWSLWGNIFDTFMGVFNVFSVKLMGDITIGHLALVPLVLGLIGFIYALGGKRGR